MINSEPQFANKYGEWALITGGSDGLGASFAHELASRGMNCMIVARRQEKMDALAAALRTEHQVEVKTLSVDLGDQEAVTRLSRETSDLDLGIIVFNAGSETTGSLFHDLPFDEWRVFLQRNVMFLTEALHVFGERLRAQGRGGLIVVGSDAAFGGGARGAMYTASKGFALNLCESLWAELKPYNVDVQTLLFKIADTPTLRDVLSRKGIPVEATGAVSTDVLARTTVEALSDGPLLNFDEEGSDDRLTSASQRRERVVDVSGKLEGFYGPVG